MAAFKVPTSSFLRRVQSKRIKINQSKFNYSDNIFLLNSFHFRRFEQTINWRLLTQEP